MKIAHILIFLVSLPIIAACGPATPGGPAIEVSNAWARAAMTMGAGGHDGQATPTGEGMEGMGVNSAAYMLLRNLTSTPDKLLRVESPVAKAVELHISEMQADVMTMRQIEFVEAPGKGEVELKPGGMHIMLIGLTQDLNAGEMIDLTLVFEKAGRINVQAEVRAP